ncbi:hypothetical protein MHYP_G00217240 [Metynnis hypsauchen]
MTPLCNPQTDRERRYNSLHSRTRSVVERAIGQLKNRWRCLDRTGGMLLYRPEKVYCEGMWGPAQCCAQVLFARCWPLCAGGRVDFPCCASVPGDYSAPLGGDSFSAFGGWAGLHWERWYQAGPLSFSQTACEVRLTTP